LPGAGEGAPPRPPARARAGPGTPRHVRAQRGVRGAASGRGSLMLDAEPMSVRAAAHAARAAGLCVVPPREDGTKMPLPDTWKQFQRRRPTAEEFDAWYADERDGLGAPMGAISGNLECLEFDERAIYQRYVELAHAGGLGELVERIRAGYEEATPGDGFHWPYRCAEIAGNTTLARRPTPT